MTKRDWLSVGFKIAGLSIALVFASHLLLLVLLSGGAPSELVKNWRMIIMLASTILSVVLSLMLLRWGDALAEKMIPEEPVIVTGDAVASQRNVFSVSLRIIGVIFLAWKTTELGLTHLDLFFIGTYENFGPAQIALACVLVAVSAALGLYLLFGGKWLIHFAFRGALSNPPDRATTELISGIGSEETVFSVSLRIIGVVLFLGSAPTMVFELGRLFHLGPRPHGLATNYWNHVLYCLILLLVGVYLITGAPRLVRWLFRKARNARPKGEPSP